MGSGGMIVIDEDSCMVNIAKFFLEFTQNESCGKCTPCREGTKRMLEILVRITDDPAENHCKPAADYRDLFGHSFFPCEDFVGSRRGIRFEAHLRLMCILRWAWRSTLDPAYAGQPSRAVLVLRPQASDL